MDWPVCQLWYTRRPGDDDVLRGRAYSTCEVQDSTAGAIPAVAGGTGGVEASKLATSLNLNGDVDIGEINLSEMNPEDIRVSQITASTLTLLLCDGSSSSGSGSGGGSAAAAAAAAVCLSRVSLVVVVVSFLKDWRVHYSPRSSASVFTV